MSLPNSNKVFSNTMETLGALMSSKKSLKSLQDNSGRASMLGVPLNTMGGDRIKVQINIYDLTPEKYKTLSTT